MDVLPLGEVEERLWLETRARGVATRHPDPVVDLVVLAHIRRLVSGRLGVESVALLDRIERRIAERLDECDMSEQTLDDIDTITRISDMIALWLSFEADGFAEFSVYAGWSGGRRSVDVVVRGDGDVGMTPWPLNVPVLTGCGIAYAATGDGAYGDAALLSYHVHPA